MRRDVWLLPQPVLTAVTAMTGFDACSIVASTSNVENATPRASTVLAALVDVREADVGIGEHHLVDSAGSEQVVQFGLGVDRDAGG